MYEFDLETSSLGQSILGVVAFLVVFSAVIITNVRV